MVNEETKIVLKKEYTDFKTPTMTLILPKNWYDMKASGNSLDGDFNAYTIGGFGYSETGKADYGTKKEFAIEYCKSERSLDDYMKELEGFKFKISGKTSERFVAESVDDFFGLRYRLVKKAEGGFLVGAVKAEKEDKKDYEFAKKALVSIFDKISIKV